MLSSTLRLVAAMAVADRVKPEAVGVVAALSAAGVACHMLTGDNWVTARIIAAQLGIRQVIAEVRVHWWRSMRRRPASPY